jgi:hypothetical protein
LVECSWLLEEVRRAGDDLERFLAWEQLKRCAIQLEHMRIVSSDNQERRSPHAAETIGREIRSTPT